MKSINTVTGSIDVNELKFTLMHEHLLLSDWNLRLADPEFLNLDQAIPMIEEVITDAKAHGVSTIVDVTPINDGRDVLLMREIAKHTQMNIIAATGVLGCETVWLRDMPEELLVKLFVRELTEGCQGTDIKCGVIKCGTTELGFNKNTVKSLRAAGKAQSLTGVPIITHCRPANTRQGLFQLDIFEEQGANLNKVVIGHFRIGDPLDYALNVMNRGAYIAIDQMNFNAHQLPHNLKVIKEICQRGLAHRLILSHDAVICFNSARFDEYDHKSYINYAPDSLSYLSREVIPLLIQEGVSQEAIHQIFIENPKNIFK